MVGPKGTLPQHVQGEFHGKRLFHRDFSRKRWAFRESPRKGGATPAYEIVLL